MFEDDACLHASISYLDVVDHEIFMLYDYNPFTTIINAIENENKEILHCLILMR